MKTYDEIVASILKDASEIPSLLLEYQIEHNYFLMCALLLNRIYEVPDEQILKDLTLNGKALVRIPEEK